MSIQLKYNRHSPAIPVMDSNPVWITAPLCRVFIIFRLIVPVWLIYYGGDVKTQKPTLVAQLDACLTGDQEIVGSNPARSATLSCGDLIMKYFL